MTEPFWMVLQRLMSERGMTQAELARRLGRSRTTIHQWYWGMYEPDMDTLRRMSKIFGCTTDELLGMSGGRR